MQLKLQEMEEAISKGQEFINMPLRSPVDGYEVTMQSSCQIGNNWGPWHATKNPEGLREQ